MSPGICLKVYDTTEGTGQLHDFILLAIPYFFGIHTAYKQQLTIRIFGAEGKGVYEGIIRSNCQWTKGEQFRGRHHAHDLRERRGRGKTPCLCNIDA